MTIETLYEELGGDYQDILERLESPKLIESVVRAFAEDDSYRTLAEGIAERDFEKAFRGVHTLKGVCANLSFTRLYQASVELTEALRGGKELQDDSLFEAVKDEYERTMEVLAHFY